MVDINLIIQAGLPKCDLKPWYSFSDKWTPTYVLSFPVSLDSCSVLKDPWPYLHDALKTESQDSQHLNHFD